MRNHACVSVNTGIVSAPTTPLNGSKKSNNKNLLRLCYVLTLLLSISAVNLYILVENLTNNQNYPVTHHNYRFDKNDHYVPGEDAIELDAAKALLEKIDENIRRISLARTNNLITRSNRRFV